MRPAPSPPVSGTPVLTAHGIPSHTQAVLHLRPSQCSSPSLILCHPSDDSCRIAAQGSLLVPGQGIRGHCTHARSPQTALHSPHCHVYLHAALWESLISISRATLGQGARAGLGSCSPPSPQCPVEVCSVWKQMNDSLKGGSWLCALLALTAEGPQPQGGWSRPLICRMAVMTACWVPDTALSALHLSP